MGKDVPISLGAGDIPHQCPHIGIVGSERRSIDDILADEGLRNDNKHVQVSCKGAECIWVLTGNRMSSHWVMPQSGHGGRNQRLLR